jgi:hypothetical protein
VELRFAESGDREVWILDELPDRMPAAGRAFNSKTVPVEVEGNSQFIVVHDVETSSVALKRAGDVTSSWTVSDKDWRAAEVTVKAFTSGKPLGEGRIELHAPSFTKSMTVEGGQAKFFAVPYGEVEVRVDYRNGGIPPTAPQLFRIRKEMPPEERTIAVTVVAGASNEASSETQPTVPELAKPPWYSTVLWWLIGLGLAGAGLVFLMRFLKERSDVVEEKLRSLGVPIPSDVGTSTSETDLPEAKPFEVPPVVPAGHCAYCGKPQADCVCRLDAPRAVPPSGEPELIGAGVELRIPEGECVVGREGDLQIIDPTVSRQHAKITREGALIKIEDLGSANGTYVDGVRIETETVLTRGSTVYFGSVKVRLEA